MNDLPSFVVYWVQRDCELTPKEKNKLILMALKFIIKKHSLHGRECRAGDTITSAVIEVLYDFSEVMSKVLSSQSSNKEASWNGQFATSTGSTSILD
jgi:hypothetical protein